MKRFIFVMALIAVLGPPSVAQSTVYVSPDVPTDPGLGIDLLPWETIGYRAGIYGPAVPEFGLPGNPAIDALHKMDRPGHWLISVESPSDLGGTLATDVEPRDVIRIDLPGGSFTAFFCGGLVATGNVPISSNLDALYLAGGDSGDLIVSFDVPTSLSTLGGPVTVDPADLVRYRRTGVGCGGWSATGIHFDASTVGGGIADSSNLIGADEFAQETILAFDIPTDLAPSTFVPATLIPGQIGAWDSAAGTFKLFDTLGGWPISSLVDALSCQANPGRVYDGAVYPFLMLLAKPSPFVGQITFNWSSSCSSGAEDYGIYEGSLASLLTATYDHVQVTCVDVLGDLTETIAPQAVDSYYLVVPHNTKGEGAYGLDRDYSRVPLQIDRPQAALPAARCSTAQILTACP